jgi:hypothetical protein
MVKWAMLVGL